ncbi:hypothetical protein C453_17629 [Haloferax elongans ATCC BAA-1513]|uniref:Uncharacterized protein n=1 Tax=Haloferax elongans ATCC BAA-1513 TaxID=1230453 RepID=M0HBI6_HALEO|nr:hypothetical protein [Haloferax elongans]ELZ81860.1 hypothetical protein C453_17629 [Haloferax elongans ATCC BAA-1513]
MANPVEVLSLLVVLEFVIMSAIVLVLVPLEVAAPIIPLLLVFLVALQLYRS